MPPDVVGPGSEGKERRRGWGNTRDAAAPRSGLVGHTDSPSPIYSQTVKQMIIPAAIARSLTRAANLRRIGEEAAPGQQIIPSAALRSGLGSLGENAKPGLILHAGGQQNVSRGGRSRPRLSVSLGAPLEAAATSVNLFAELSFGLAMGPARAFGSIPPGGGKPPASVEPERGAAP